MSHPTVLSTETPKQRRTLLTAHVSFDILLCAAARGYFIGVWRNGSAALSKGEGWGFESLHPCVIIRS